MNVLSSKIN